MKRNLELVHWVDSHSAGGVWMEPDRLDAEMPIQRIVTLGWVVFEDDDRLVVSGSHDAEWQQVGEVLSIAKVAITERRRVTTPTALDVQPEKDPGPIALVDLELRAVGED